MKKTVKLILPIFLIITAISVQAQSSFEGVISFKIDYKQLPQLMESQKEMLPKQMDVSVKDQKSRIDQTIGGDGEQIIINDHDKKTGYLATSIMGQKILVTIPKDKYEASLGKSEDVEVKYLDEEKEIAGYTCKKALVKQNDNEITVFYTESLPSSAIKDFYHLKGLPLEYETIKNGMHMLISATNVTKKSLSAGIFEKPTGYQEISFEQIQQMIGNNFQF